MEVLRVGVIGAGTMGQRHCRVYSNLRRARLEGILDADPRVGCQVAEQYGMVLYEQLDHLLENVDAVSLAVPTPLHFDLAVQCLARGIHVLIEKPMTETLEQAEELTQIAEFVAGVSPDIPWHVTAFHPSYKMTDRGRTPAETIARACELGEAAGLRYVYAGNLPGGVAEREHTCCHACGARLITRLGFNVRQNRMAGSSCPDCHTMIPGVWQSALAGKGALTGNPGGQESEPSE